MSHPDESLVEWLNEDQNNITPAELEQLFNTSVVEHAIRYLDTDDTKTGFDFAFGFQANPTPPESTVPSSAPTPDISEYNFGQTYSDYPTPGPSTPYPYPIEQQQYLDSNVPAFLPTHQRPRPLRSQTNTPYLSPLHQTPGYTRRRSLSQSDVNHITLLNSQAPNPTFIRLQTPRSRSVTPERKRPTGHHSRSSSRKSNGVGRYTQATSVPDFIDGRVVKRLGDPISPDGDLYHRPAEQQQWIAQDGYERTGMKDQVVFRHILGTEQMERSRKIIEIGAMAVTERIDPTWQGKGNAILQKLDDVERYLRLECAGCEDALKGCACIREIIESRLRVTELDDHSDLASLPSCPDPPSTFVRHQAGTDGEDEMDRLMRENGVHDSDHEL